VVPLQVFFVLGPRPGTLTLFCSFVLQLLLFYARQLIPAPPFVLDGLAYPPPPLITLIASSC
jgi:hypothetical protein